MNTAGYLHNRGFDLVFIVGIAALSLAAGAAVVWNEKLFLPLLFADLWLLGYQHVVATFTRLVFDRQSFSEYRFLVTWLPVLVIAAVVALALLIGPWIVVTIYFYWQWFHYTRQSWGISCAYRKKSALPAPRFARLGEIVFWSLPVLGVVYRSWQQPDTFFDIPVWTFPVGDTTLLIVAGFAFCALLYWVFSMLMTAIKTGLPLAYSLFMASHFGIFYVAYLLIEDMTHGWLVVNIWHNAQYIAFVWLYNNRKFSAGIDTQAKFLSFLCQKKNTVLYFGFCLLISTALYYGVDTTVKGLRLPLVTLLIIYQAVNFHHYIVDGLIWKFRKKKISKPLEV